MSPADGEAERGIFVKRLFCASSLQGQIRHVPFLHRENGLLIGSRLQAIDSAQPTTPFLYLPAIGPLCTGLPVNLRRLRAIVFYFRHFIYINFRFDLMYLYCTLAPTTALTHFSSNGAISNIAFPKFSPLSIPRNPLTAFSIPYVVLIFVLKVPSWIHLATFS